MKVLTCFTALAVLLLGITGTVAATPMDADIAARGVDTEISDGCGGSVSARVYLPLFPSCYSLLYLAVLRLIFLSRGGGQKCTRHR